MITARELPVPIAVVVLGSVRWSRSKGREFIHLFTLHHHHENIASLSSTTLRCNRLLINSNGDASSITRGAGHSRPCSPTERTTWHENRSLEVYPDVFSPQVFIFATCSTSRTNIIRATIVLPDKDYRWSILCLTHRTRSSDISDVFP